MSINTTFEEIIDASKNLYLEVQKKYGVHVHILSHELIPQNALQRLFLRPKVRVMGCIESTGSQEIGNKKVPMYHAQPVHDIGKVGDIVENNMKKIATLFEKIHAPAQSVTDTLLEREAYEGLMYLCEVLRKNDFSSSFIGIVKDHVIQNFTLRELKDVSLMNKAFTHILQTSLMFYKPSVEKQASQRIITLVGPTGTGKTTAISKLSVEFFVSKSGKKRDEAFNLRIASLDSFKVGAADQIQKIADVLTVSCECIHEAEELRKYARKGARPEILLVDTTGQNPREIHDADEIQEMLAVFKKRNEVLLVVDATTSEKNLEYIFETFATYEYSGVIITKIDEAQSIGVVVSLCAKYKTPIAYLGWGQEPCKGLSVGSVKALQGFIHGF